MIQLDNENLYRQQLLQLFNYCQVLSATITANVNLKEITNNILNKPKFAYLLFKTFKKSYDSINESHLMTNLIIV